MKSINSCFLIAVLSLAACKKDQGTSSPVPMPVTTVPANPTMTYFDLSGKSLVMDNHIAIDLDDDKHWDVIFRTERRSFDRNTKVADVYLVTNSTRSNMPINPINETTPHLQKGDTISRSSLLPCEWHVIQTAILMQEVWSNNQLYWEGSWKDLDHQYLAIEVPINGKAHLGWIELWADTRNKRIVLYRAAVSKTPQTAIRAGY